MPTMIHNKIRLFFSSRYSSTPLDLYQSSSANYGGIGAVIGMKSLMLLTQTEAFDEHGSLKIGVARRLRSFQLGLRRRLSNLTDKILTELKSMESWLFQKILQTLADWAALEAVKKEADLRKEFFTNFARIWRMKARPEYMQMLASVDVHAPGKLLTNVQLPNFDDFFTTFDVKAYDGMYANQEDCRLFGNFNVC